MRFSRGKAGLAGRGGDEGKEGREGAGKAEEGKVDGREKGKARAQEQLRTSGRCPVPPGGMIPLQVGTIPPNPIDCSANGSADAGRGSSYGVRGAGRWFAEAGSAGGSFPGCRDCAGMSFRPHLRWPTSASASRHHRNKGRSFRILMKKVRPPVPRMGRSVGRTGFHGWPFFFGGGMRGPCAFRMQPPFICGVKRRFVVQVPRQYGVSGADVPPRPSLRLKMSRAGPA